MKILYISKNGHSPVRIYRGEGVLERLKKIDPSVDVVFPNPGKERWVELLSCDVVYFQRSTFNDDVSLAQDALNMGVPCWYDVDDDYFNIPKENLASQQVDENRLNNMRWFLENCPMVTVSTKRMVEVVGAYRPVAGIVVIPNALDDYAFPDFDQYPGDEIEVNVPNNSTAPIRPKDRTITWRGGVTHQGDILEYAGEFWKILKETPKNVKIHFMGYEPWYLGKGFSWHDPGQDYTDRINFTRFVEYYNYMGMIRTHQRPEVHVVPLTHNAFNLAKSNISLLEAVYAGALPVVRNWDEWQFPGVIHYSQLEDFADSVKRALNYSPEARKAMWLANVEHVKANYLLSKVNQVRLNILKTLIQMSGGKV
jgi:hypothetical protein